jgi:hypothetical protein
MDDKIRKEEFSYGYIYSLVASCGYVFSKAERPQDNEGIDIIITTSEGADDGEVGRVTAQVKCTSLSHIDKGDYISYPLDVKNYNHLIKSSIDPRFLILVVVPSEYNEWMSFLEDSQQTIIKKCSYLVNLQNYPAIRNISNKSIKINKKTDLLTRDVLIKVMTEAKSKRLKLLNSDYDD